MSLNPSVEIVLFRGFLALCAILALVAIWLVIDAVRAAGLSVLGSLRDCDTWR